eukprot:UN12160
MISSYAVFFLRILFPSWIMLRRFLYSVRVSFITVATCIVLITLLTSGVNGESVLSFFFCIFFFSVCVVVR